VTNVVDIFKGANPNPTMVGPANDMEWLVFQLSLRGPEGGESDWISVYPEDLPPWVLDNEVVRTMRTGMLVCGDPARGRLWFRVQLSAPPKMQL
jgi:hypothetical protein